MPGTIAITFSDAGFPLTTFSGSVQALIDEFVANLSGTIPDQSLVPGQVGGIAPVTNIGAWLDGEVWKCWDGVSSYVPTLVQVGNNSHVVQFQATLTGDRTLTLQDKSGIMALTSDVFNPRNSINLATTTPAHTIDWQNSFSYFDSISADTTYTSVNSLPGQRLVIALTVTGTHTPTFPAEFQWLGGSPPGAIVGTKTDLIILDNISGTVYGQLLDNFA
jgi:hypothetical protein